MVNSETGIIGLIGHPVAHSKSPQMHNASLRNLGLNDIYLAFDVKPENLKDAIQGMRALYFKGCNVTIPHKVNVIPFLDEISEEAARIGAVNTIVNKDGKLIGYNTDGEGYLRSLKEETGFQLHGKRIMILGAGGASRAISYTLSHQPIEGIVLVNRDLNKANALLNELKQTDFHKAITYHELPYEMEQVDLIINTTSIGMYPNIKETLIKKEWIQPHHLVSDIVYNPLETKLLQDAKAQGAKIHSGLGMFIYQGVIAFEKWTGITPDTNIMRRVVLDSIV
ncbi:shikimate dehydrogenase [Tepidibacillus decaturensis]|uniref:Shikimate dehydrogenase (NADP(+)) n=1 Tax=Tepidibacillus decaturensis TaxID=1413211 RepID=A0A135L818_9BACI|nr:shikimate dehydrogenase [Tepidibacillus decaturensis]KXG44993.1 shikimate dehydrogenase [Tepidibacillus decaturensis]